VRSGGRIRQDELGVGSVILPDTASPVRGGSTVPQIQLRGGNVQVNDPSVPFGDYIQIFAGFRPFVRATQSEVRERTPRARLVGRLRHVPEDFVVTRGVRRRSRKGGEISLPPQLRDVSGPDYALAGAASAPERAARLTGILMCLQVRFVYD
jgi:hypothetical protein